jgi:hypothetical protein
MGNQEIFSVCMRSAGRYCPAYGHHQANGNVNTPPKFYDPFALP